MCGITNSDYASLVLEFEFITLSVLICSYCSIVREALLHLVHLLQTEFFYRSFWRLTKPITTPWSSLENVHQNWASSTRPTRLTERQLNLMIHSPFLDRQKNFLSFLKESFPCRKILVYVDQVRFTLLGLLVFLKETSTAICTKTETQRFFLVMHCCKLSSDMKFAVILLGAVCRECQQPSATALHF